jgi:D-alanyl-lipoteichoic acid acyltransferase DltB (MBOAT superfamily)
VIFSELIFFAFFSVTATGHWLLPTNEWRKRWLFIVSYFFYGYWDYRFLALIFASTCWDFATGIWLSKTDDAARRRTLVGLSVAVNLGILGFFKYYNFFVHSAVTALAGLGIRVSEPTLSVVLPVGVSFFTFQSMSYTIDVYRRRLESERNFLDFALYVAFFPQLVAGPIARASHFLPQLKSTRSLADIDGRRALLLFAIGYFKKACVADQIATAIDPLFQQPAAFDIGSRVLASVLYAIQIYCDFSGYTDMAIAVAALLGYELAKNRFLIPARLKEGEPSTAGSILSWAATFAFVAFCFTIFRCSDIGTAWTLFTGPFRPVAGEVSAMSRGWWAAILVLGAVHYAIHRYKGVFTTRARSAPDAIFFPAYGVGWALLLVMTPLNAEPFIYFQF